MFMRLTWVLWLVVVWFQPVVGRFFLTRQLPVLSRVITKCALHDTTDAPEHTTTPQQGWGVVIR
jgi:hypothetical protein